MVQKRALKMVLIQLMKTDITAKEKVLYGHKVKKKLLAN